MRPPLSALFLLAALWAPVSAYADAGELQLIGRVGVGALSPTYASSRVARSDATRDGTAFHVPLDLQLRYGILNSLHITAGATFGWAAGLTIADVARPPLPGVFGSNISGDLTVDYSTASAPIGLAYQLYLGWPVSFWLEAAVGPTWVSWTEISFTPSTSQTAGAIADPVELNATGLLVSGRILASWRFWSHVLVELGPEYRLQRVTSDGVTTQNHFIGATLGFGYAFPVGPSL